MKHLMIALTLLLFSCGEELKSEDLLPDATGEHGHILVLMDDHMWEGSMGEALIAQLDQNAKGPYLRPEPLFNFFRKEPGSMTHVNKLSRIILKVLVDQDSTYQETAIIDKRNYYAKGQLFLVIKDSDPNRLLSFIQNDFQEVIDRINQFEMDALIADFKNKPNKAVKEQAQNKFGIGISLPKDSKLKVTEEDFMWVKYDRSRNMIGNEATGADGGVFWIQEGIIFWSEPYSDSGLTRSHILSKRDTILKYNIPGKVSGSYMATEYDSCCAPKAETMTYQGADATCIKGLWIHAGTPGAFGGGPFVQYTIHNKEKNSLITICGYVYAPKFNKREYIRELEAMLNTIDIKA
jgi:hypothetical protein